MNILFITLLDFSSLDENNIYTDLLREFLKKDHNIFVVSPRERRFNEKTHLISDLGCKILKVKTGNIQKTGIIEKGVSTILLEHNFKAAIKKYFSNIKFDLVLYSTPPITLAGAVKFVKKRDRAKSYLLLKDIFPQNAVDMGMMSKAGIKSIIYKIFRWKEKQLYSLSDYIGCMSEANRDYVIKNNPEVPPEKVHVCPNSIEVREYTDTVNKNEIRAKYGIPTNKTVFIYGGNLGKPQDIPFIIECLKANADFDDRFFVICGTGTEYPKLKKYVDEFNPDNILLINGLPKDEYETFAGCCDVGLIFLDHRFTIPNFPSRLLSYMQNGMPVLACTDKSTDIGKIIVEGNFGWWCESNSAENFKEKIDEICGCDFKEYGRNGYEYLAAHYSAGESCRIICESLKG